MRENHTSCVVLKLAYFQVGSIFDDTRGRTDRQLDLWLEQLDELQAFLLDKREDDSDLRTPHPASKFPMVILESYDDRVQARI